MIGKQSKERRQMNRVISTFRTDTRRLTVLAGTLVALCCWLIPASAASALESNAAWKVITQTNGIIEPNTPAPGDADPVYSTRIMNVGAAPTTGDYTLTETFAEGITPDLEAYEFSHSPSLDCKVTAVAPSVLTCKSDESMPASERILNPGGQLLLTVPVKIGNVSGEVSNLVEIEGGGVAGASGSTTTPVTSTLPTFGFLPAPEGVSSVNTGPNGAEISQAGATPTQEAIGLRFPWVPSHSFETLRLPDFGAKNLEFKLPKGVAVNPNATPVKCTEPQLETHSCPLASQVGTITLTLSLFRGPSNFHEGIYNMVRPPGVPAVLGFEAVDPGIYIHIIGKVRSETDYGLSAKIKYIPTKVGFIGAETELWGVPTSPTHDGNRGECTRLNYERPPSLCPIEADQRNGKAFLTTPTSCEGPLVSVGTATSYGSPDDVREGSSETAGMQGCNRLQFEPSISSQPSTSVADSPSGLDFDLHLPQSGTAESPESEAPLQTADLKDAKVVLPVGMTLNPSAANGLEGCSSSQIGLKTPVGQASPVHFDEVLKGCPNASKIGKVEVVTPLLEEPLTGSVYLAKPYDNPFSSLLAIYLAVEDEKTGIVAKLPGRVDSDPATGQLTTTFSENPELPIEDVKLTLFNGSQASLKTPLACGTHTTGSDLVPWTTPQGADEHPTDSFTTSAAPAGGPCPNSEAAAPNTPSFQAGTTAPEAGSFSPFALRITRKDGTQQIAKVDTTLPEGLLGKLAGIPYCPESAIALAKSREAPEQGKVEQASPSCPAASEVGTLQVTAGAGITPIPVNGHAYLAGPYSGAPLSLVTIVPAVAGPFDLGDVVTRIALDVGTFDAQIHAVSDPLPTIIDGIPLDVRSIDLRLNRPGFTLNPTSCEQKAITGSVTSPSGSVAPLNNSFQVGGCKTLAFKPKLKISLKGPTKRTGHPALKAVLTMPSGGANIAKAQVGLPHGEFLDNANIGTVCTQPQLKTQTCPAKSIYGRAKAWTPLLDKPLEGPVYLGAGFGHKLPDLVADLNGQIRVLVHGKIDTDKQGGIRNTFEAVPDAPVSKFILEMQGGKKKGLLVNSENVCRKAQKASVQFSGQNGKLETFQAPIQNSCKGGKKGKAKKSGL